MVNMNISIAPIDPSSIQTGPIVQGTIPGADPLGGAFGSGLTPEQYAEWRAANKRDYEKNQSSSIFGNITSDLMDITGLSASLPFGMAGTALKESKEPFKNVISNIPEKIGSSAMGPFGLAGTALKESKSVFSDTSGKDKTITGEQASGKKALKGYELAAELMREQQAAGKAALDPYMLTGKSALNRTQALMGLSGPQAQAEMIRQIEQRPEFQEKLRQGEEAMLASASATGGLRGGDIQRALMEYRPQLLSQAIETELGRLGALSGAGLQAAGQFAGGARQLGAGLSQLAVAQQEDAVRRKLAKEANESSFLGDLFTIAGGAAGAYFGGPQGAVFGAQAGQAAGDIVEGWF
jgi:hypothetical protein